MARYVMANRRAGKFMLEQKRASRAALEVGFSELFAASADVVNDLNPSDDLARRVVVFEADPEEVAAKAPTLSADVMVEPEIMHFPMAKRMLGRVRTPRTRPRDVAVVAEDTTPAAAPGFVVRVTGSGAPLLGAEVLVFIRSTVPVRDPLRASTNVAGEATFTIPLGFVATSAVVLPAGGHWSMVVQNPVAGVVIDCPSIQPVGPLDWWHRQFGVTTLDLGIGAGIRVGVIDTGVGPHGCLSHVVKAGAFIDGAHDPDGGADVDSHGTHVSGLIAARPVNPNDRVGIAPGVTIMAARVFPGPDAGANQADIANAIDHLSRTLHADLINMSLGASQPSQIERDAIIDAAERGTLCVCAAGNTAGAVNWPAAFPEAIAVSALGLQNTAPTGSLSAARLPSDPAKRGAGGLFLANFSCFGLEVDTTAPGVGTLSTVPERFGLTRPYAAMDGTSMASPLACGALAVQLSRSGKYQALTGAARTEEARTILRDNCVGVGLASTFQGRGIQRTS
jgi:subtilisin family serine protease